MAERSTPEATRRTQKERTALSDERMLAVAITLICERGTAATTLKEIGELAGYSRGLAGYRFKTKAGLLSCIVKAVGEEWLGELRKAVQDKNGLAAICAGTDAHYRFVRDAAERIRAFYVLWFDSIGPDAELKKVIAAIHERRRRDVERWIRGGIAEGTVRPDVNVRSVAEQFCAAIIGIVYQWLVTPEAHKHIRDLHEGLKDQMTRALALPETAATGRKRKLPEEVEP
ncbi:MAG: TetR/AcrR family transcriptional regulator [Gammaproteobacteria bacterium]|nr:TetR/AcrR family transcriptional regulator [Gammaproteobacteria bacterium]